MEKLKTAVVEVLNGNRVGILIGLISGAMINFVTSDDGLRRYKVSIGLFFGATVIFIFLLGLRNKIDVTANKGGPESATERGRISWAINEFEPAWGNRFILLALLCLLLSAGGVWSAMFSTQPRGIEDELKTINEKLTTCISTRQ